MKRSAWPGLRTHRRGISVSDRAQRTSTHGVRCRRLWRTPSLVILMLSGLLLSVLGCGRGTGGPSREVPSALPQDVPPTQVVIVKEDTLPPVMQRIAQCESRGQHFTKEGKVLRGHRHPQDTGLFQINAVVWAKKAEALGYDIRTPEGNTQMACYIFENYGSEPWRSSAKCWRRPH